MHPAPGSDSPSYAAVVGSVDSSQSFFLARTQLQSSRQEMIVDLKQMSTVNMLAPHSRTLVLIYCAGTDSAVHRTTKAYGAPHILPWYVISLPA